MPKKEVLLYLVAALGALYVLGYSVHMLVGGLVAPRTERLLIAGVVGAGVVAVALMAWDVARRRRGRPPQARGPGRPSRPGEADQGGDGRG